MDSLIGKILTNHWKFIKFVNIFPRQNFAPYGSYYEIKQSLNTNISIIDHFKDLQHLKISAHTVMSVLTFTINTIIIIVVIARCSVFHYHTAGLVTLFYF